MNVKRILACILSFSCLFATSCSKPNSVEDSAIKVVTLPCESGVYNWLNSYSDYNFDECDVYTSSDGFQFSDFVSSMEYDSSLASEVVYQTILHKSVDSVSSITVKDVVDEIYTVEVTFTPYESIEAVVFNETSLREVTDAFVIDDCTAKEYKTSLTDYIESEFNECFVLGDNQKTIEVALKQGTEGELDVVLNAEELVIPLLNAQGITSILEVFEEELYTMLSVYASEYRM